VDGMRDLERPSPRIFLPVDAAYVLSLLPAVNVGVRDAAATSFRPCARTRLVAARGTLYTVPRHKRAQG
jgi:hypothetical protein